jgi:hypothetical protein
MWRAGRGGLRVWRRSGGGPAAALIDLIVFMVSVIGAVLSARWLQGGDGELRGMPSLRLTRRHRLVLAIVFVPLQIRSRNWRSPGWRLMGLRQVDARGRAGVSPQRADPARGAHGAERVDIAVAGAMEAARRERVKDTVASAEAYQSHHRQAMARAIRNSLETNQVPTWRGCAMPLLLSAARDLPASWSPLKQTVPERLAGTVVVRG